MVSNILYKYCIMAQNVPTRKYIYSFIHITSMGEKSSKMNGKMFIFIYLSNNESSVAAISSHTAWSMPNLTILSSSKNNGKEIRNFEET